MNWLMWRVYKKQWLGFLLLLIFFVAVAVPSGLRFRHEYQHLSAICGSAHTCNAADLRDTIFHTQLDGLITNAVKLTLLGIPFVLGMFWGVPLLAKEYAEKTTMLVWTQGIPRKKWLTAKLAWTLGITVVYVGVLSALATWFSHTGNTVNHDRFDALAFTSQGIVPVAVALFAVSAGILFGAWFRKILPALGVTFGLLLVSQIVVPIFARPHYVSAKVYATPSTFHGSNDPLQYFSPHNEDAWVVGQRMVDHTGKVFDWLNPPRLCKVSDPSTQKDADRNGADRHAIIGRNGTFVDADCLNSLGYHWEIKYQPSYRYWDFQRIEAGMYLALSALAIGATYAFVVKRDV